MNYDAGEVTIHDDARKFGSDILSGAAPMDRSSSSFLAKVKSALGKSPLQGIDVQTYPNIYFALHSTCALVAAEKMTSLDDSTTILFAGGFPY